MSFIRHLSMNAVGGHGASMAPRYNAGNARSVASAVSRTVVVAGRVYVRLWPFATQTDVRSDVGCQRLSGNVSNATDPPFTTPMRTRSQLCPAAGAPHRKTGRRRSA